MPHYQLLMKLLKYTSAAFFHSQLMYKQPVLRADDILSPNAHTTPIRHLYYLNPILKFHIFPLYFCEK